MITLTEEDRELSTTSGTVAMVNLHAQIDGLAARAHRACFVVNGGSEYRLMPGPWSYGGSPSSTR